LAGQSVDEGIPLLVVLQGIDHIRHVWLTSDHSSIACVHVLGLSNIQTPVFVECLGYACFKLTQRLSPRPVNLNILATMSYICTNVIVLAARTHSEPTEHAVKWSCTHKVKVHNWWKARMLVAWRPTSLARVQYMHVTLLTYLDILKR
jgi:hypothetical protein